MIPINEYVKTHLQFSDEADKKEFEELIVTPEYETFRDLMQSYAKDMVSIALSEHRQELLDAMPSDEDINDLFGISEAQCQDPYWVEKEKHQKQGINWMKKQLTTLITDKGK